MQIYFNPLDIACKSKVGGVLRKEKIQFNVYLLNELDDYATFNEKTGEFHAKTPPADLSPRGQGYRHQASPPLQPPL